MLPMNKLDPPQLISNSKHSDKVTVVKFNSNGSILASGGNSGNIKIWDTKNNYKQIAEIRPQVPLLYLTYIAFDSKNSFIASSHSNNTIGIKIWSLEKAIKSYPQPLQNSEDSNLLGHTQPINKIMFSPTNPFMIISASNDLTIRTWSLKPILINQSDATIINLLDHSCSLVKDYLKVKDDKDIPKRQIASKVCQID